MTSRRTTVALLLLTASLATVGARPGAAAPRPHRASAAVSAAVPAEVHWAQGGSFALTGHGYGSGHGLSQYGAYGAAVDGLTTTRILGFYYPGTVPTAAGDPAVRVTLSTAAPGALTVLTPARDGSLTVTDHAAPGRSLALPPSVAGAAVTGWRAVPAGTGRLALQGLWGGGWQAYPTVGAWTTTGALSFAGSTGTVALQAADLTQRDYRGALEAVPVGTAVAHLDLVDRESYLRSVVPSEMPASWPAAAVQAQAVAARTYEDAVANPVAAADICDTTSCQVYAGRAVYTAAGTLVRTYESAASDAAVAATAGTVLTYAGMPAFTQFGSADGGWTTDGGRPYLPAQADPYDAVVPSVADSWTATLSAATVGARLGVGAATELVVGGRDGHGVWGGRTTSVTVVGTAGSVTVAGTTFAANLGLRSPWWTAPTGAPPDPFLASTDLYLTLAGGASGRVEVHGLSRAGGYASYLVHAATALGAVDGADWRFFTTPYAGSGRPDLWAVHLRGTGSGRLEIHVLSAASGYRTWLAHIATAQPALPVGPQDDLSLAPFRADGRPDLYVVAASSTGSGRVEVHVLSAAAGYGTFLAHDATALTATVAGTWSFLVGDPAGDGDLVGIHHSGSTGSGRTEAHRLTEASGYATYSLHAATPLALQPVGTTEWLLGDWDGDGVADVFLVLPAAVATGRLEVHVLDGADGFATWLLHVATALPSQDPRGSQTSLG